jgi:isopenicillin N synthase-like dioxygenase
VVNPTAEHRAGSRRISIGYFLHPNYDAEIACLPTCSGPGNPARYEPVRAGDMMRKKLEARAA